MKSHSIPKSFFKKTKDNGKCILFQNGLKTQSGSFDPKEFMLCENCEKFLSRTYEAYGTRVLKNYKHTEKYHDHIVLNHLNYNKFYLYLMSILWRASISKATYYSDVNLGHGIEDILRTSILKQTTWLGNSNSFKLDHFIRISIYRISDSSGNVCDKIIKGVLSNICRYQALNNTNVTYYWICDGFIIFYYLYINEDIHITRALKLPSQLTHGSLQKIYKLEISENNILRRVFNILIRT